jgi:hypothetical protein
MQLQLNISKQLVCVHKCVANFARQVLNLDIDSQTLNTMAPKKGGGGGGGGTTSSSSSSDCGSSSTYPCTAGLYQIYGSAFSQAELYGQVILFSIWTLALIAILIATLRTKAHALKLAITLFLLSFIFCVVRFALILAESDVPIGYRFESSIVVLLQRLGMVLLLAGVLSPDASKLYKFSFYPVLGLYAILNVAYLILDFFISAKAVNAFKDDWRWRLSDRDSGLTNTPYSLHALTTNGPYTLNPFYVESRMLDSSAEDGWQNQRSIQIKIGVAADFLALALAVFINIVAALSMLKRRKDNVRGSVSVAIPESQGCS